MDIYVLSCGPLGSNMYAVADNNEYVIIDPSVSPEIVKKYFQQHNLDFFNNLKAVFMTHAHFDHVLYVDAWKSLFPDVPFYLGKNDFELLEDPALNCSYDFGNPISFGVTPVPIESTNCGFSLNDNVSCVALNTPGHTYGQFVFIFTDSVTSKKVMFSGDMLFQGSVGRTDFFTGNSRKMMESIRLLSGLSDEMDVYPGHGPSTSLSIEKKTNPYFYY